MKNSRNKFLVLFTLISTLTFTNCENSNELPTELSIQQKVALLEGSEWLLKGFEDRVMHTFKDGKKFTYYGTNNVFSETPIPGAFDYTITGNLLTIDLNFGNIKTYEVAFSCNNTIVKFYENGELNSELYKKDSNYKSCL
ncbi:MAG: hypothetical protein NWQ17_08805 [Polaribacter sp.]|nr:hypothetical protein [Polaribacter sp.]